MVNHLKNEFPRLLRLSRARLPRTSQWENEALQFLRGGPATPEVESVMTSLLSELPALLSMQPSPTRNYSTLIASWENEDADSRVSTQHPTPVDDDDVCPVCLAAPKTDTTICGHGFCGSCLDICARARPYEPLRCPLCRHHLRSPVNVPAPPPGVNEAHKTLFSGGRPRVNESWLNEAELNIYLGYHVPVLNLSS